MLIFIIIYLISIFGVFGGIIYFIKYVERSHMRERCRKFGNLIYKYLNSHTYNFLCEYFLQQILIFSDMFNGFLEGMIGLEPMIELYIQEPPKEIIKEIIKEIPIEKIIEKEIIIEKPIEVRIPVYNEEKIIEEIRTLLQPSIKLIKYDGMGTMINNIDEYNVKNELNNEEKNTESLRDTVLLKNIENIICDQPANDKVENSVNEKNKKIFISKKKSKDIDSDLISSRFYEDTEITETEKNNFQKTKNKIKTNIEDNGRKVKVSIKRKNK